MSTGLRPDGSAGGGQAGDAALVAMELDRLTRLQAQLVAHGCDAGLFYDPHNIR